MSGAPVLRGTRLRPRDVAGNAEMGEAWIADAFGVPIEDVRTILDFQAVHREELPLEYFPPDYIAELGADEIDWSGCLAVDVRVGGPFIRDTPVRPIDLIANAAEGEDALAYAYSLPIETVRALLRTYHGQMRQLAPAV